jgi:hypothetical protein
MDYFGEDACYDEEGVAIYSRGVERADRRGVCAGFGALEIQVFFQGGGKHAFNPGRGWVGFLVDGRKDVEDALDEMGTVEGACPHGPCNVRNETAVFAVWP